MTHELYSKVLKEKIVVILRGLKKQKAIASCEVLAGEGIKFMEVPLNTESALEIIEMLAAHFSGSDVHIGAGTVLNAQKVEAVDAAGGKYIISPNVSEPVIRKTVELGLLSMPGFQTPTEAFAAMDAGADLLKMFPCSSPGAIRVVKSVVDKPIFAVGGIDKDNKNDYLAAADGLGVGIGIFNPEMTPEELACSARDFLQK